MVKAYYLEKDLYVVAEIKQDDWGITSKKYIFCDVPESNWSNFETGFYNIGRTRRDLSLANIMDITANNYI